jgi:hypothetical protein
MACWSFGALTFRQINIRLPFSDYQISLASTGAELQSSAAMMSSRKQGAEEFKSNNLIALESFLFSKVKLLQFLAKSQNI